MQLPELIANNKHLRFIDSIHDRVYTLGDIEFSWEGKNSQVRRLIFLYLDNSVQSVGIYLSFLNSDNALVLLSDTLNNDLKEKLESEYKPFMIFDDQRKDIGNYMPFELTSKSFTQHIFKRQGDLSESLIHENIKVLLSTSGTTGSPKFVKLSEQNLRENALSIIDYLPIKTDDVTPLNLPLHYSYGLSVLHSNAIAGGTLLCNLPDVLQKDFWSKLDVYKANSIAGVPYIYEMLKRIGFLKKSHPSLAYITQAGGNLSAGIKEEFLDYCNQHNIKFYVMYGQTEATARISYVPPDMLRKKLKSIGQPIKNGKLLLDPDTGELKYRGPNIYGGYANCRADLQHWEVKEVLHTGDIAICDDEGFYFIKGRLKRFVKLFGNRINLDELEAFCKPLAPNGILACTGINDEQLLIAHNDATLDETKVKNQLNKQFKIHPSTIRYIYMESLPLTSNGKVNYNKISDYYVNKIQ